MILLIAFALLTVTGLAFAPAFIIGALAGWITEKLTGR